MITVSLTLDSLFTYLVVLDFLALLAYVLYQIERKNRINKAKATITDFISSYFADSETDVKVDCFSLDARNHFIVLIESKPIKRFRCSNILEDNLIKHFNESTGYEIEKIYWRFPIQLHNYELATPEDVDPLSDDLYFSHGVAQAKKLDLYKVSEAPWSEFESGDTQK